MIINNLHNLDKIYMNNDSMGQIDKLAWKSIDMILLTIICMGSMSIQINLTFYTFPSKTHIHFTYSYFSYSNDLIFFILWNPRQLLVSLKPSRLQTQKLHWQTKIWVSHTNNGSYLVRLVCLKHTFSDLPSFQKF